MLSKKINAHKIVALEKMRRIYAHLKTIHKPRSNDLLYADIIIAIARSLKPMVYVELGVYQCDIINKVLPYVQSSAYAADISQTSGYFLKKDPRAHFFLGKTTKLAEKLRDENISIDMMFIDADHRKESVLEDFNAFFPLVKEDGIIFLHDGYPRDKKQTGDGYCSNSWEAIDELTRTAGNTYEMMTLPQHPGLTLCRKRTKQIPWI